MNNFLNSLVFWGSSQTSNNDAKFMDYLSVHNKGYGTSEEFLFRQQLFMEMDAKIIEWNNKPGVTHYLAHNKFSDWTAFERKKLTGFVGPANASNEVILDVSEIPESVNWVDQGAVNAIQNQGRCGSCWAFSAIGAMEGAHFIKTGKLMKLSEQQCVDCVKEDKGCNGGWQEDCFEYAMGDEMNTEAQYPYTASSDTCWADYDGVLSVLNHTAVQRNSATQLKAAIAKQPVSVTIDAGEYPFQHYFGGIITDPTCGTALDHAVLAVGYGVENGVEYFLVRNSWGADWGEDGYVRIGVQDNSPGICGIQELALYPETD